MSEPLFIAHLKNISKPLTGQKCGLCPFSFNQGIGCQRCTVNQQLDLGRRLTCLIQYLANAFDDAPLGCFSSGQNLGGCLTGGTPQHYIGKGSADVHCDATGRFRHRPVPDLKNDD